MLPHAKPQLPAFYNPMRKPEITPTVTKQKTLMASNSSVSLFDKLSQEDEELCVQGAPPPVGKQYHLSYLQKVPKDKLAFQLAARRRQLSL